VNSATKKAACKQAIAAYASEMAGTKFDLDPELEAASLEFLAQSEASKPQPRKR
jgi:hypothetical protein